MTKINVVKSFKCHQHKEKYGNIHIRMPNLPQDVKK